MVNHIEHFLKTHRAKLHAEQLIKLGDMGYFGTVGCCAVAGNGRIWIFGGVVIDGSETHKVNYCRASLAQLPDR